MVNHDFKFNGGEYLARIGASWFVSYFYYLSIDNSHQNWKNSSTYTSRISKFNATTNYHKFWLEQVLNMNENNLRKNEIGLNGIEVKEMAKEILKNTI